MNTLFFQFLKTIKLYLIAITLVQSYLVEQDGFLRGILQVGFQIDIGNRLLTVVVDAQVADKRLTEENAAKALRQEKHPALLETV